MPAARLTQQRYSHGSCTLEVSFQPSALSQWHPRLVAQALTFKLWLEGLAPPEGDAVDAAGAEAETEVETASILIAQGDRATLEAIAQNIQQQTRRTLLATVSTASPTAGASRDAAITAVSAPQFPPECTPQGPLSYLQLSDLMAVLGQYEQAAAVLPVNLGAENVSEAPRLIATGDAIIDDAATRATASQAPVTPPNPTRKNNLIPFPTTRRRPAVWISSAAVALVAVGLGSTMWQNSQLQDAQLAERLSADSIAKESANEEFSAALPPQQSQPPAETPAPLPTEGSRSEGSRAEGSRAIVPEKLAAQREAADSARESAPATARPAAPLTDDIASDTTREANLPQAAEPTSPDDLALSAGSENRENAAPESADETTDEMTEETMQATVPPAADVPASAAPPPVVSLPEIDAIARRQPQQSAPLPPSPSIASAPVAESEVAVESEAALDSASLGDRASADPSAGASLPLEGAPRTEASRAGASDADTTKVADSLLTEVQTYFEARWSPILAADQAADQGVEESLRYQIQLSAAGDVVSFTALNEVAQVYRDRLVPADTPLSFASGVSGDAEMERLGEAITIELVLMPMGQVQVNKR
ncbi:MAG: hypothetical protein AAFN38_12715 [Cyanobacteria bacterium J06560_5]